MKILRAALIVFVLAAFAVGGTALARTGAGTRASSQAVAADDGGDHGSDDSGHHGGDDGDHSGHHDDDGDGDDDGRHGDDDDSGTTTGTTTSATTTTTTGGATTTTSRRRSSAPATVVAGKRLIATVGPGFSITLKTPAGAAVPTLRAGTYTVVVRDRSDEHNFHLSGRGVNKATSVDAVATQTWSVKLSAGTYRFVCDPHASSMRGSLRVT